MFEALKIYRGREIEPEQVYRWLAEFGYTRVAAISEEGDFSVKGENIFVFPATFEYPIRIELGRIAVGVLGFGLVALGFLVLREASAAVYLIVAIPSAGIAVGALLLIGFFDAAEMSFLRALLSRLASAIGPRRTRPS